MKDVGNNEKSRNSQLPEIGVGVYLNNAATTKTKPEAVYKAVDDFARGLNVSPGRGTDDLSVRADNMLNDTRKLLAKLFNCGAPENIIFTLNCSDALNTAVKGVLKSGDHVIISCVEHNSILRPLRYLERLGIELSISNALDDLGVVSAFGIRSLIKKNTKLIAVLHASNVTGAVQPVADIGHIAHDNNVLFLVDAAQTAGIYDIDMQKMNIDLLAFAGHKGLMGPMGTGGLAINSPSTIHHSQSDFIPLRHGGTGSLSESETQPEMMPDKFETGTPNAPGIAGLKAGVEFILKEGTERIREKVHGLADRFAREAGQIKGIRIFRPKDRAFHGAVVSFKIEGREPANIGRILEKDFGIIVRTGLHCAPLCHKAIGTFPKGTVRVSTGYFNTEEEIAGAISALIKIAQRH